MFGPNKHRIIAAARRAHSPVAFLLVGLLAAAPLHAEDFSITVSSGNYQIVDTSRGQRIEMDGFGYLMLPGAPMLPSKTFMIALPPGAVAKSVEITGAGENQVPGRYEIVPCPQIVPLDHAHQRLTDLRDEWQRTNESVYSSDGAYPEVRGKLKGSGSLRKYSYASVSFCPFEYHPQSGRLICYDGAIISVDYDLPYPGTPEGDRVDQLMWDTVADEKAENLFANYEQIRDMYQPKGARPESFKQPYDYVIITTEALYNVIAATDFVAWKQSLGHNVVTVLVGDPALKQSSKSDLARAIRDYLRDNLAPWGIEYVLLVGDVATVPMRYCYPDPSDHSFYPDDPQVYSGEVPTDFYYADLSLPDEWSWDSDQDGYHGEYGQDNPDFIAEVSVGRIPTSNAMQLTYVLNKLIAFEQDTGSWKNNALHTGTMLFFENQNHEGYPEVDGAVCLHHIEQDIMSGWTISHYSEQEGLEISDFPWPAASLEAFEDDWRTGQYAVVNWSGHGSPYGAARTVWAWDDGDGVPESPELPSYAFINADANLDDDYPSVVFAISCFVGYPEPNPQGRLGVDLLTKPSFGSSIGVLSSSRPAAVSGDWLAAPGGAESICYEFNRYMINGPSGPDKVGDALYDSKAYCTLNYAWDHIYEYQNMFNYNLYGDPALAREGVVISAESTDFDTRPEAVAMRNYPNPFNPVTTISYSVPRDCHVSLEVFDIRGKKVATLIDEQQGAGVRSAIWDGHNSQGQTVASGVYFYRLQAEDYFETKQMVLLK